MGLNALLGALMDQVRRLKGTSVEYSISSATTALAGVQPGADLSGVTAAASNVLTGKKFVNSSGTLVNGSMPNRGAVSQTLNVNSNSYTVPSGYHNGSGTVSAPHVAGSAYVIPDNTDHVYTAADNKFYNSFTIKKCRVVTQVVEVTPTIDQNAGTTTFRIEIPRTLGNTVSPNHISISTAPAPTVSGSFASEISIDVDTPLEGVYDKSAVFNYITYDSTQDVFVYSKRTTEDTSSPLTVTRTWNIATTYHRFDITVNETRFNTTQKFFGRITYFDRQTL